MSNVIILDVAPSTCQNVRRYSSALLAAVRCLQGPAGWVTTLAGAKTACKIGQGIPGPERISTAGWLALSGLRCLYLSCSTNQRLIARGNLQGTAEPTWQWPPPITLAAIGTVPWGVLVAQPGKTLRSFFVAREDNNSPLARSLAHSLRRLVYIRKTPR